MTSLWLAVFGWCCFWLGCKLTHKARDKWYDEYTRALVAHMPAKSRRDMIYAARAVVRHLEANERK